MGFLFISKAWVEHFFFHPLMRDQFSAKVVQPLFALRAFSFQRFLEQSPQPFVVLLDQIQCVHGGRCCNRYASTLDQASASSSPAAR
jgi:hypothetical protein